MRSSLRRAYVGSIAFLPLFFVAVAVFAQTATSTVAGPSPVDLFDAGTRVYADWKSAGALAGTIALVKLFVDVTKLRAVDNWLWDHQWRWIRPITALLLGGLTSVAASAPMKASVTVAFVHGVLAGASAIGVNELVTMLSDRTAIKEKEAPAIAVYEAGKTKA